MSILAYSKSRWVQIILSFILFLGVIECVFIPSYFAYIWARQFAVQILWAYLFLGILFLIIGLRKLMFVSFICCAILSLYLKNITHPSYQIPISKKNLPTLKIANYKLSFSNSEFETALSVIKQNDADIITFQEFSPIWADTITKIFQEKYPNSLVWSNFSSSDMALFSKYELTVSDTIYYDEKPTLHSTIKKDNKLVNVLLTQTETPYSRSTYNKLEIFLDTLAGWSHHYSPPLLVLGGFNIVTWSDIVQNFTNLSKLKDSRRGFMTAYPRTPFSLNTLYTDHIFHSAKLKCIDFQSLELHEIKNFGIMGTYQIDEQDFGYDEE